jgi:CheY-like chemotaxis protein
MEPETTGRDRLVLIVEDEPDNREIMRGFVEDILGFRALLASDGGFAIDLARDRQPAIVLMDLNMPFVDGFDAIARLKADPQTEHIPVVAVTALGRATDIQQALDLGADDFLIKPFEPEALAAMLKRHMPPPQADGYQPMS